MPGSRCGSVLVRIGATAQRVAIPDPGSCALTRRPDTPRVRPARNKVAAFCGFEFRGVAMAHDPDWPGPYQLPRLLARLTGVRGGGGPSTWCCTGVRIRIGATAQRVAIPDPAMPCPDALA